MSKKGNNLDKHEKTILGILNNHKGRECAISGKRLAELAGVRERGLRNIINHLIFGHGIRIVSSSKRKESGYYFPRTKRERQEFFRVFRQRGITSLTKAAQVEETSLLEISIKIVLEQCKEGEKVPGARGALSRLLRYFYENQELYSSEIDGLRSEVAPLLVDREHMQEIKSAAEDAIHANARLQELTKSIAIRKTE